MKGKRLNRSWFLFLVAFVFALAGVIAVGCGGEKREEGPETGVYYYDAGDGEYLITLSDGDSLSFNVAGENKSGTYTVNEAGDTLTFTFEDKKDPAITATLQDDVLTFTYQDVVYRFLKKIDYTVHFETNGGSSVPDATVVNGKPVARPQTDPTYSSRVFVGWYADSAFRTEYLFGQPVRGDLTIYARFVEPIEPEFTVKFDLNYAGAENNISPVNTTGGKLFGLPTPERSGFEFAGWWVSHYESGEKLTYRYNEQTLAENVTLFAVWKENAPLVSVNADGVTWTADGVNNSYSVTIKGPDGTVNERTSTASYSYDFASKPAGDYEIEVSLNGVSGKAFYRNKALARVSVFRVEGSTLLWNKVENATSYTVSLLCGTAEHDHSANPIVVTEERYDFGECDMREGGIVFAVTSNAENYLSSTSEEFTFERRLDETKGLAVDPATEVASWEAVQGATSYDVTVTSADGTAENFNIVAEADPHFSMKFYGKGNYTLTVKPRARGWNSPEAASVSFEKKTIATPKDVHIVGYTIEWERIEGAERYEITVNGKTETVEVNSYELDPNSDVTGYEITVRALAQNAAESSLPSDLLTIREGEMTEPVYSQGTVTWDPVFGASKYYVKVNEGQEFEVTTHSAKVTLTKKGENSISVCAEMPDGDRTEWVQVEVTAYSIEFVAEGASAPVATIYLAANDPIPEFAQPDRFCYYFRGWYTAAGGAQGGGRPYDSKFFEGQDLTLYAAWEPYEFEVTFVVDSKYGQPVEKVKVKYNENFKFPVPVVTDYEWAFLGWYMQPNGGSTRFSDYSGACLLQNGFNESSDTTLYAYFLEAFSWEEIKEGANAGWRVSKSNLAIVQSSLAEITIPEKHNDKPVTEVDDFSNLTNLQVINIPASIKVINLASGSVAFRSDRNLKEVNIYPVEQEGLEPVYFSHEGVLYRNNTASSSIDVVYAPVMLEGEEGVYTIHESATKINTGAFGSLTKVTEIVVPASVTMVESGAFTGSSSTPIVRITFLEPENAESAQPLTISAGAFQGLTQLTEITFSTRLEQLDPGFATGCTGITNVNTNANGDTSKGGYSSVEGLFTKTLTDSNSKELIYIPAGRTGRLEIPNGITSLGSGLFGVTTDTSGKAKGTAVSNIEELVIPGWVSNIAKSAFRGNEHLRSIQFQGTEHDAPLTIGAYAFYDVGGKDDCNVTELTLPENLVTLEEYAFGYLTKLTQVTVNSRGMKDGETYTLDFRANAFANVPSSSSSTGALTFYVTDLTLGDYVPYFDILSVFGPKVKEVHINQTNVNYAYNLLPDGSNDGVLYNKDVTSIAFYPATRQGEYVTPESLKIIPAITFYGKSNLPSITIGKNVELIGENAFFNCTGLQTVKFAEGGTADLTIEDYAFASSSTSTSSVNQIKEIELPERTVTLGASAFRNCVNLVNVKLPATLREMRVARDSESKFDTFYNCTNLMKVEIAEGNTSYAAVDDVIYTVQDEKPYALMFAPLGKEGEVNVPDTVQIVMENAFYENRSITKVTFADHQDTTYTDPETSEQVTGPLPLTIEQEAFYRCSGIGEVKLPRGLVTISEKAFQECRGLKMITIPNTVERIEKEAFYYCSALSTVEFEDGGTKPLVFGDGSSYSTGGGSGVFNGCRELTEIELPERTQRIGVATFSYSGLVSIKLPASLEFIGEQAFGALTTLKTVTFAPESQLYTIDGYAFYKTSGLEKIELPEGLVELNAYAFNSSGLTSVKIPGTVTVIGKEFKKGSMSYTGSVFSNCPITNLELGEGIEEIMENAFSYIGAVEELVIPASVKTLGNYAFSHSKIKKVKFADESKLTKIADYSFYYMYDLESVDFGKTESLEIIGMGAFYQDSSLREIVFPASVRYILNTAFYNCINLSSVKWEEGKESNLQIVGGTQNSTSGAVTVSTSTSNVFYRAAITSFSFPDSANTISVGPGIFFGCSKLESVHFSKSVGAINNPFQGCATIKTVTIADDNPVFKMYDGTQAIFDSNGSLYLIYGQFNGEFSFPEEGSAQEIAANAFKGQIGLKRIVLPQSIRKIGNNAFQDCIDLEEVVIPANSNLAEIGNYAFDGCTSLNKISFENAVSLNKIGTYCFRRTGITNVNLSNTQLKTLSNYAFNHCEKLVSITFPSTISGTLGTNTFEYCSSLASVDLKGFTVIGTRAFYGANLSSLTIPSSVTQISAGAFADNKNLSSLTFENGSKVYFAGPTSEATVNSQSTLSPFQGTKIEELSFPDDREIYISTGAFANMTSLKRITSWGGVKNISSFAFAKSGLEGAITLPNTQYRATNSATISSSAGLAANVFMGCTGITKIDFADDFSAEWLGNYFFADCSNITSFDFAKAGSITYLGNYFFQNCTSLETVDLTSLDNLIYLGATFTASSKKITAPTTTNTAYTFDGCTELTTVSLPSKMTHLGGFSFYNCEKLTTLNGFESITFIPQSAFFNTGFTKIGKGGLELNPNVSTIADAAFAEMHKLQTAEFGTLSQLKKVGKGLFQNCEVLTLVDLSGTQVVRFNNYVSDTFSTDTTRTSYNFEGCINLTQVKLPTTLIQIGIRTFNGCISLKQEGINLDHVQEIADYSFQDTGFTSFKFPASLTKFSSKAFAGCENVQFDLSGTTNFKQDGNRLVDNTGATVMYFTSPADASGTITINDDSEMSAYFLEGVEAEKLILQEGVTTIPHYAFYGSLIKEIEIPDTVTYVGGYAFYGSHFKEIKLSKNVTFISHYAFAACYAETIDLGEVDGSDLQYNTATKEYYGGAFGQSNSGSASLDSTSSKTDLFNGSHVHKVILPNNLYKLGQNWFKDTTELEEVNLPESLQYLTQNAFVNSGIKKLTIPGNIQTWGTATRSSGGGGTGYAVFTGSMLEEVTYLGTFMFNYAFYGAEHLRKVTLSPDVEFTALSGGTNAFKGCLALTTVMTSDMPEDTTGIHIPEKVTAIPANMFDGCESITAIELKEGLTTIDSSAFNDTRITKVEIPESVITMNALSFANNPELKEAICHNTLTGTLTTVFSYCSNLQYVKLPGATGLAANAFTGCTSLKAVWISSGIASFVNSAFTGWTQEQTVYFEMSKFEVYSVIGTDWLTNGNPKLEFGYTEEAFLKAIGRQA